MNISRFEVHDGLDDDLFQVSPFSGRLDAESRGSVFVTETIDSYELEKLQNKPWYGDAALFWKRTYDDNDSAKASFKFPPRPWPEVVDLGDLLADEPPLLARGVVCDMSGKPIPFAVLEWVPLGEHPRIPWQSGSELSCDQQGRFSIGEWHDPQACEAEIAFQDDLGLWAWAPGYQLALHPTPTFPQDDLEIRLPVAIALKLELQLSPGVDPDVLAIELSGPAVEAWSARDQALKDDPDHALLRAVENRVMTIDNLSSGTLLLRAVDRKRPQLIHDQLEIEIPDLGPGSIHRSTFDLRDDI